MSGFDPSYNVTDLVGNTFIGQVFAFTATGGYSTVQGFEMIERLSETQINIFDTTGAVEIAFPAGLLNSKIGLYKTPTTTGFVLDTVRTSSSFYDNSINMLTTDSLTLTSNNFVLNVPSPAEIISVGKLSTAYLDFAHYVADYFNITGPTTTNPETGISSGFSGLFSNVHDFNPNNGVFDASALFQIISSTGIIDPDTHAGINQLSGSVFISNITKLLRYAVDSNPFANRNSITGVTAMDTTNVANYGVTDGFLAGDIIFVPNNGFAIQFNVNIDYTTTVNNYVQNNPNATTIQYVDTSMNTLAQYHETSIKTKSYIGRQISTPLLFRLVDTTWQ